MSQQVLAGRQGSVVIPGTPNLVIAKLSGWKITIDAPDLDVSALGDEWASAIAGQKKWQGSLDGYYIGDEDASQAAIVNALLNSASLVLQLQIAAGRGFFEGSVHFTQMNLDVNTKNADIVGWTFVGDGALQHAP